MFCSVHLLWQKALNVTTTRCTCASASNMSPWKPHQSDTTPVPAGTGGQKSVACWCLHEMRHWAVINDGIRFDLQSVMCQIWEYVPWTVWCQSKKKKKMRVWIHRLVFTGQQHKDRFWQVKLIGCMFWQMLPTQCPPAGFFAPSFNDGLLFFGWTVLLRPEQRIIQCLQQQDSQTSSRRYRYQQWSEKSW